MITTQPVVGIAVSKATLAACHQVGAHVQHLEVANTSAGFRQLVRCGGATSLYVLEATGPYYLAVAYHLVAAGAQVAVLNPLVVKRFIQMHLGKGKSDRKDAQWLLRYGQQQTTPRWQPEAAVLVECRQVEQTTELLIRQKTMVHNALEALQVQPVVSPTALKQLQQTLLQLEEQVQHLEAELLTTVEQHYCQQMPLLQSIPGIGRKTAAYLLLFAGGFTSFENLALIAVCNKLLKQAYAIVTSGVPYQADFTRKATLPLAF